MSRDARKAGTSGSEGPWCSNTPGLPDTTRSRPKLVVSADGHGVVNHAGSRLLVDLADAASLTSTFSHALQRLRPRGTGHDPGRVAVDLAVMVADGGEATRDLAVRDQRDVFGPVASTPTAWRVLAAINTNNLNAPRAARAAAREIGWLQTAETTDEIPPARAGGRQLPGLVLDIKATLVTCHGRHLQTRLRYHPMLCFLDSTGEALAGLLRPGNAGANHITVVDAALAQIPDAYRHGTPVLIRADSAGSAKAFLTHLRALRQRGIQTTFSVGHAVTEQARTTIRSLPDQIWHPALEQDGTLRAGAEVGELTGLADLTGYPDGTRIIVRRERPYPGAQLSLFDQDERMRHQVLLTDTLGGGGSIQSWRSATALMPASRTTSAAARPPASAASLPPLRHQPGLAGAAPDRHRPARLGGNPAAGRRTGHRRAQEAPIPPPAHRRPDHQLTPPPIPADCRHLALGQRARTRLRPPRSAAPPGYLTSDTAS